MSDSYNQQRQYGGYQGQPQSQGYGYGYSNGQPSYGQYPSQQQGAPYGQEQQQPGPQVGYQNHGYDNQQQQAYAENAQQYPQNSDGPADGERGLGGALVGGLAGGYGGHKTGHGLLGAVGGALLGSFTEDKLKKHHQKKDESGQLQRPHSGQGSQGQGQQGASFSSSFSENLNFVGKR